MYTLCVAKHNKAIAQDLILLLVTEKGLNSEQQIWARWRGASWSLMVPRSIDLS